ncbi:MAG: TSUP family transporter, partial [Desulfobacterales bacterium]|nr:TSUP family transporter [Desulfobacterales bacterium]
MIFPVSGVRTSLLIPPLVAMVIGFVSSLGGLSGAFLILPFQMSIFGYVAPSVSATNFVYNIVGIPGGVAAYIKEKRMNWALAAVITVGTLP